LTSDTYARTAIHEQTLRGEPLGCRVIDAHAHLLNRSAPMAHFPLSAPAQMVEFMDVLGIDQACISVVGAGDANDEMLAAVAAHPGRLLGFVLVNPRYPADILPTLERCFDHPGVRGIGEVHPTSYHHDYPVTGPAYVPVWEFAAARRLPVLIHAGPTSEAARCRPSALGTVAAAHPDMNVLVGHCGGYDSWDMLEEAVDTAIRHDNVYLELCATGRYPGILEHLVSRVGPDKIVFGTDAPFHDWTAEVAHVAFARIPDEAKEKIFGRTMAGLLDGAR
jgi:uncharacterized protein